MEVLARPVASEANVELVRLLRTHRDGLANAFAVAFDKVPRWAALAESQAGARDEYLTTHFQVFADYLTEYFARNDETFRSLFIGESVKALYEPALDGPAKKAHALEVLGAQREQLRMLFDGRLPAAASARVEEFLQDVQRTLVADCPRTQRLLLVGDCVFLDILPFIVGELMKVGVSLVPEYVTSKNVTVLHDELRKASALKFDLVFFSPFSYEFSPSYAQLLQWRHALTTDSAVRDVVVQTWSETRGTIDLLADLFDCPIHVHNSAAIIREENAVKRVVKLKATAKIRASARRQVNQLLLQHVASKNAEAFEHLFVLDEERIVAEVGEAEAGAYFYKSPLQHPARLGQILSREYVDLIFVNAWLSKRKVVVCDLDNTLWDGVIGEGAVAHFHDRQKTLLALKAKGVVLAINSKNDPANVHWWGGTLGDDDFVSAAISWDPKVEGMQRIQSALNLKIKDYVFVDDREDERELMHMTYPAIACVDATDPATWRRFALWARLLEDDLEMDRTLMYKQREERKAFVKEDVASDEDRAALFTSLGLELTISVAKTEDLKRTAELINRTNQFNLEGSRVTFKEVTDWHHSPDHVIVLGQTRDRFGDMGTTCVAVVHVEGSQMRLLPFVLSCRVFGYGIEHGVMHHLLDVARARGVKRISGRYVETPQNSPCREFLAESGFAHDGDLWIREPASPGPKFPEWLKVSVC
jgi:FkbH-like protein